MVFQVIGDSTELPISGKAKHICQETLHFGSGDLSGFTHDFDVVTPLT